AGVSLDRVALGIAIFRELARAKCRSLVADAEVSVSARVAFGNVSLDVLQSKHPSHGRSARAFLHRAAAAGIQGRGALACARSRDSAVATAAARAAGRR